MPAQRTADDDDRVYVEPVDPWATGEAAAIAAGGHGFYPGSPVAFPPSSDGSPRSPNSGSGASGEQPGSSAADEGGGFGAGRHGDGFGSGRHGGGVREGVRGDSSVRDADAARNDSSLRGGDGARRGNDAGVGGRRSDRLAERGRDGRRRVGGLGGRGGQAGPDGREMGADARALSEVRHGGSHRKAYLWGAGALVILLVVGGVVWHFRPGYRALDYQPLSLVRRVSAMVPVSSSFSDAEVIGNRIYFASSDSKSGQVGVVAIDAGAGKPSWRSLAAGTAERWESMTALPDGVALLSASDVTGNRRVAVLGARDGRLRWERVMASQDRLYFVGDTAVLADNTGHWLYGLRLADGNARWRLAEPKTDFGTSTSIFVATTKADLAGPATVGGRPLRPDAAHDNRVVLVSADRSARVIDTETGTVRASAQGVAGSNDEVVAHDGRLIVRQSEGTQRIVSYPLDKLGEPKGLYTAQSDQNHLTHLTPCGDRICFVEDTGYDSATTEVTAVDLDKGGRAWHRPLPKVDGLVPVGPAVLATTSSQTTMLDGAGAKVWSNDGVAARLDGGNLLEFAKPLSSISEDPAVAGQHLGDQPVQLGPLSDVRSDTCSWNTSVIACVADKDFEILRFAK